jgi:two-component system sensor histidine kinase BaeS
MAERGLGPLGRRLFAAFVIAAMSSVLVLTVAALVGTSRGLDSAEAQRRTRQAEVIAARVAEAVGVVSDSTLTWSGDLSRAAATADAFHVAFLVRAADGTPSISFNSGMKSGMSNMAMMGGPETTGPRWTTVDLVVKGATVGTVSVRFDAPLGSSAQSIAWSWILAAAIVALLMSFLIAWFVTRRIAEPLLRISMAARRFASGDRTARTHADDATARWELGVLARAFDATAEHVVRSESARQRLSADVAHELRTPLAALQAGLEELRDGLVPPEPGRLAALHAQSMKLGRVIEDLEALAAAETASLSLRRAPVALHDVVADAFRAAKPILDAAGLRATLNPVMPVFIEVDSDRMHQAVSNLLSNAARHCRVGDEVAVALTSDADYATITVMDSGPGLPDSELSHVFERLWRGTQSSDVTGSGIGLAIVRELVEAHGGTATAARNASGGLTFEIRIPR